MKNVPQLSTVLVKPVSADCNLACRYCFYSAKHNLYPETKNHRMRKQVLQELISQFLDLTWNRASFCWQGGEPTLTGLDFYRDVMRYQKLYRVPGQIVENSLQTNGLLIDERWARFLKRQKFLVGLSLDGSKKFHDYYRRDKTDKPSYERVMKAIEYLKKYQVEFNVLALLNQFNVKYPRELYNFFIDQSIHYLQFIPCVEWDPVKGDVADYSITPKEYGSFLCEVFDEWGRKDLPETYVRVFDEILISYVTGESPSCDFSDECGKYIVIEYNGDVYVCDFFVEPRWYLGNIMNQSLEKIVESEKFLEFSEKKGIQAKECKGCNWIQYCNGGCPKHWIRPGVDKNYFCESYKIFFNHSHHRFLQLKDLVEERKNWNII
jgi:uncharacterized protein